MSTTHVAKLIYGIKEADAKFYCEQDRLDLKDDCEVSLVSYFYDVGLFGVELESSEEGCLTSIDMDTFMQESSLSDVIENYSKCKVYLCVTSY
ncbi:hypothetical protein AXI76_gp120 [Pseudoalteromonas phage H101]|uniref:Uncharacterized protein n=1 Tax=Pseudoalteromonas phage H101 TaxID=1654919 RepID=A0A0H4IT17_9CAUD|nr:hypothetical protein AXI76_gp120 [Pseudoalteromonas phage H101]AKO61021.1 hypothetical protein [Pseudoalteromonas phage H101]